MSLIKKTNLVIFLLIVSLVSVSCGLKKSNPLDDYKNLEVVPEDQAQYIVPVEANKDTSRETQLADPKAISGDEQVALQNELFQITTKTENLNFLENKENRFELIVRFLKGKTKFDVDVQDTLGGAVHVARLSQDVNYSKFRVSVMPRSGLIMENQFSVIGQLKVSLKDIQYVSKDEKENETTQQLFVKLTNKISDLNYVVRKDKNMPTLVVNGLGKNLRLGEVYKFSVDVKAPASYTINDPLTPEMSLDLTNVANSNESVGTFNADFVTIDKEKTVEKLSQNTWRTHYIFDTRNIVVTKELHDSAQTSTDEKKLYVNISFRVNSNKLAVSDKKTIRFYISLN